MYSPRVIEARLARLQPGWKFLDDEVAVARAEELELAWDPESETAIRALTKAELAHIASERAITGCSFPYWQERYAKIKTKSPGVRRMKELWEPQKIAMRLIGNLEESQKKRGYGILLAILKARQLGISTLIDLMLTHRAINTPGFTSLLAADVRPQSTYLYNIIERSYANLPWWMKPHCEYHTKEKGMFFDKLDSLIQVDHGNRPVVEGRGKKKDLARGTTTHFTHLSELENWSNPKQIYDGLMPSIPKIPGIFAAFESTGEFRRSDWHSFVLEALAGSNLFTLLFIPWYAEPTECRITPPVGWAPDVATVDHKAQVERTSPKWMEGRTVHLEPDQMYFWEVTRMSYAKRDDLGVFACEYCSDPSEAFRSAKTAVVGHELLEWLRSQTSFPRAWEITGPFINHGVLRQEQDALLAQSRRAG